MDARASTPSSRSFARSSARGAVGTLEAKKRVLSAVLCSPEVPELSQQGNIRVETHEHRLLREPDGGQYRSGPRASEDRRRRGGRLGRGAAAHDPGHLRGRALDRLARAWPRRHRTLLRPRRRPPCAPGHRLPHLRDRHALRPRDLHPSRSRPRARSCCAAPAGSRLPDPPGNGGRGVA